MSFDLYSIIYLITNLFSIVIIHKFVSIFFEKRKMSAFICFLSYFSYFIVTSIVYLYIDVPLLTLSVNWILILCITLSYKSDIRTYFLCSVYILVFMMIPEIIVGAVTGYFEFSFFSKGNYSNSIGIIATRLLTYMESLFFSNFKAVKNNKSVNITSWIAYILIPVITLILEIMIIESQNVTQAKVVISVILILLLNITAFYLYDLLAAAYAQIAKTEILKIENELYCKQCEIMQSSTEDLQAFRHDINNQFIAVYNLLEAGEYDSAKDQVANLSDKIKVKIIYSTTGNIAIDGIINYKLQGAVNEQISVNTEIAVPYDLNIEIYDIITILGNLIDNALCALKELVEMERSLSLKLIYNRDRLIVRVSNPYMTEIRYENGKIITSKNDSHHYGYGLKNVEKIVEKYDGYMEINHDNNIFTVDILLFVNNIIK